MAKNEIKNLKKNTDVKKKRKLWVTILAPEMFNNVDVGESYCSGPESLVGKVIKVNMMALTQDPRRQGMTVALKITAIKGDKVITEFHGLFMSGGHTKRVVRRETSKIDDSFMVEGQDKVQYLIKPLAITRAAVPHSIQTSLRKKWREYIAAELGKNNFADVVHAIIAGRFQRDLKDLLKKVMPLNVIEIRTLERK